MKSRLTAFALLAALIAVPNVAGAVVDATTSTTATTTTTAPATSTTANLQGTSFDQYPSFIQVKGKATTGTSSTDFVLRCGYSTTAGKVSLDPTLNDLSLLNASTNTYTRYQNIAGKPVVTSPDPATAGGQRIIVEVVQPDGTVKAKNCQADASTDTISGCTPTQPLVTAAQAKTQTDALEKQCSTFIAKAQVDPATFSASQTAQLKQKLDSKLSALEAQ